MLRNGRENCCTLALLLAFASDQS